MKAKNSWLWIGVMSIITYLEKYFTERPVELDGKLFVAAETAGYVGGMIVMSAILTLIVYIFSKKGERKWDYKVFTIAIASIWFIAGLGNYMIKYKGW